MRPFLMSLMMLFAIVASSQSQTIASIDTNVVCSTTYDTTYATVAATKIEENCCLNPTTDPIAGTQGVVSRTEVFIVQLSANMEAPVTAPAGTRLSKKNCIYFLEDKRTFKTREKAQEAYQLWDNHKNNYTPLIRTEYIYVKPEG
jgi:hypothetical protein